MAAGHGLVFSPLQLGRAESATAWEWEKGKGWNRFTLPDVTVWTSPGEHHEVKHKNPTQYGSFSLEAYRFHALLRFATVTGQAVMYTIHNHDLSGGRLEQRNDIAHWLTANVKDLEGKMSYVHEHDTSYINGQTIPDVCVYYWPIGLWIPLAQFWQLRMEDLGL